jgi:hypothetical protein
MAHNRTVLRFAASRGGSGYILSALVLLRKVFIRAIKTSHTAATLCAIFVKVFKNIDKNEKSVLYITLEGIYEKKIVSFDFFS